MSAGDSPYYSDLDGGYSIYQGSPHLSNAARNRDNSRGQEQHHPGSGKGGSSLPQQSGFNMNPNEKSQRYGMDPFPQRFQASDGDESKSSAENGNRNSEKGIKHLLSAYADKCSLNGVIFIKDSKYMIAKIIWTILLVAALVVMVLHLYELSTKYYSYEKQSKVELDFQNLQFPAVTFCNVNAMKRNRTDLASEKLQNLIDSVNPEELYDEAEEWDPAYEEDVENYDENGDLIDDDDDKRRKKRSTTSSSVTVKSRTSNFFDDFNFTDYDDTFGEDYETDTFSGSWEAESQPAAFDKITKQFISLYNKETGIVRQQMGHQIQDMLIQCSFAGRKCLQQNFTLVASSTMGNCYTIQYDKFVARSSGPSSGLSLMLFLEPQEYIAGITNSKGIKVVVHEPGTIPFPDEEGMSVGAGTETNIGLRWISIARLGDPYGECTDPSTFQEAYKIKYTRQACQQICEMEEMVSHCGCYDATKPVIYTLLGNRSNIDTCQKNRRNVECMEDIRWNFETNATTCHCSSPCKEVTYRKTLSSKPWPERSFAKLIAKTVCKEKGILCNLMDRDLLDLRENFVKVNIFFETLNFENFSEQEDYTEFQFLSDIGGTIGLYVGLSVLSMFEVFHLIISICKFLCCTKRNK